VIVTTREVGPVRVAWTRAEAPDAAARATLAGLGRSQFDRWLALDGVRADAFATGRLLLTRLAARLAPGAPIAIASVCPVCGEDHGPPRALGAPLALSVGYSGDLVVVGVAPSSAARSIGVDLEPDAPLAGLDRLFPDGAPDAAGWTRIEAVLKADGRGLRVAPDELRIGTEPGRVLPHARQALVPSRAEPVEVTTVPGPAGHVLSVAVVPVARSAR
jgi:4'-phosphopantetheinyl transferase